MNRYLYLDIETLPAQRPDVIAEISASLQSKLDADIEACRPPGNYKKQETIDAWMAEEHPKAVQALRNCFDADVDAAYRKTGLDGAFGQICVIGFALDGQDPHAVWSADWQHPNCERELLEDFGHFLTDRIPLSAERAMCVVGHHVAGFDLRYLVQRSIVNGVMPVRVIAGAAQAKPWETDKVYDTMVQWSGIGRAISLDKLCKALSVPTPKTDITGATVWDAVKAGRIAEVAEYCKRDVIATRAVHLRMTFQTTPVAVEDMEDVPA